MSNYDYTRSGRRLNYGETRALNPEGHGNVSHGRTAEGEYVPSWYSHRVYNVDQCEGLPESFLEDGARQNLLGASIPFLRSQRIGILFVIL